MKSAQHLLDRRAFLRRACYAGMSASAFGTLGLLQRANAAAVNRAKGADYKALVCVYLDGGADTHSLLIPREASSDPVTGHNTYFESRGGGPAAQGSNQANGMAIARDDILGLNGEPSFGFNPGMTGMRSLWNNGNLAAIANIGGLLRPVTPTQAADGIGIPPQLFSHSDQSKQWHQGWADNPQPTGWFGRVADQVDALNSQSAISMNISIAGNNIMQVGDSVVPYGVDADGPAGLDLPSGDAGTEMLNVVDTLMTQSNHLFAAEYSAIKSRAMDNYVLLSELLDVQQDPLPDFRTPFQGLDNSLAAQLEMVARLIALRNDLNVSRQTFFVSLGSWDTHNGQLDDLPVLIAALDEALAAFYDSTVRLGVAGDVTTFTTSEFGRTLNSNGEGTDHAWGGHHFVMGGAVDGGRIFGTMPDLTIDGPQDLGRGRLVPTIGVEQLAAPIATWFGVPNSELGTVFPNLHEFDNNLALYV